MPPRAASRSYKIAETRNSLGAQLSDSPTRMSARTSRQIPLREDWVDAKHWIGIYRASGRVLVPRSALWLLRTALWRRAEPGSIHRLWDRNSTPSGEGRSRRGAGPSIRGSIRNFLWPKPAERQFPTWGPGLEILDAA